MIDSLSTDMSCDLWVSVRERSESFVSLCPLLAGHSYCCRNHPNAIYRRNEISLVGNIQSCFVFRHAREKVSKWFHKFVKNMEFINAKMTFNKISGERNCIVRTVMLVWNGRCGKSDLFSVASLNWREALDLLKGPWDNLIRWNGPIATGIRSARPPQWWRKQNTNYRSAEVASYAYARTSRRKMIYIIYWLLSESSFPRNWFPDD